jgi:hypothetical protein
MCAPGLKSYSQDVDGNIGKAIMRKQPLQRYCRIFLFHSFIFASVFYIVFSVVTALKRRDG